MGHIKKPLPVKLFVGLLSPEHHLFAESTGILSARYGPVDMESPVFPWGTTDYYREEMGRGILRKFIFFRDLAEPDCLSEMKLFTNALEDRFATDSVETKRRKINLDPGYVTEAKVVLASTKDFSHRISIGQGIYAEVTLRYSSKERSFCNLEHTYFDFRTGEYIRLFNSARSVLRQELKRS